MNQEKKILCIKDLYSNVEDYLIYAETDEEVMEILEFPIEKLFSKGKIYPVELTKNGEWRTKDDTCNEKIPYNHVIRWNDKPQYFEWFDEHFQII